MEFIIKLAKSKWFKRKVLNYSFFVGLFILFIVFMRGLFNNALDQVTFYSLLKGLVFLVPISVLIGINLAYKRLKEFSDKHSKNNKERKVT